MPAGAPESTPSSHCPAISRGALEPRYEPLTHFIHKRQSRARGEASMAADYRAESDDRDALFLAPSVCAGLFLNAGSLIRS